MTALSGSQYKPPALPEVVDSVDFSADGADVKLLERPHFLSTAF
jgi:hypothetical protein